MPEWRSFQPKPLNEHCPWTQQSKSLLINQRRICCTWRSDSESGIQSVVRNESCFWWRVYFLQDKTKIKDSNLQIWRWLWTQRPTVASYIPKTLSLRVIQQLTLNDSTTSGTINPRGWYITMSKF